MARLFVGSEVIDDWHPLDGLPPPEYQPEAWNAPHVLARFAQARRTIEQLPGERTAHVGSLWPAFSCDWDRFMGRMSVDMQEMAVEGTLSQEFLAAYQDWTSTRNRRREQPSAKEISLMWRAIVWPGRYLFRRASFPQLLAFQLDTYANAFELDLQRLMAKRWFGGRYSVQQVLRQSFEAAEIIADGLIADEEVVF